MVSLKEVGGRQRQDPTRLELEGHDPEADWVCGGDFLERKEWTLGGGIKGEGP